MRQLLIALHAALGASAVGAGGTLARDPSGGSLDLDAEWLRGSPFADYRIPGLFLGLVIGTTNLVSAVWLSRRRSLAPLLSLGTGVLLVMWIAIQTAIIGFRHWTQAMWWGVFLLVTALAAREVRRASVGGRRALKASYRGT
jgi:hypothetical protein